LVESGKVNLFGIRHHGPGSARSLLNALTKLEPDCILIEGPPDANDLIEHVNDPHLRPPVSLLIYAQDNLRHAVNYPFAVFSPEWQAMVFGKQHGLPVRFIDLPQTNWLAIQRAAIENAAVRVRVEYAAGKDEPGAAKNESGAGKDEPGAGKDEPGAGKDEPGAGKDEPCAAENESGAGKGESGAGASESAFGTSEPASGPDVPASADASTDDGDTRLRPGEQNFVTPSTKKTDPDVLNLIELIKNRKPELEDEVEFDSGYAEDDPTDADSLAHEQYEKELLSIRRDPLSWLAKAAGYDDSERWWENLVEHRRADLDVFAAIREAMTALRRELSQEELPLDEYEPLREAHMRQCIRAALKEGFKNIAVICGAWHVPALAILPPAKEDQALLKGMPKVKVEATWIPWTHGRLALDSGYGAGVRSPGWYHHLWTSENLVIETWLANVARLLREEDLDASSAHVIEAVRLSEALASMRNQPLPGLKELSEAVQAVFCFGSTVPMQLIDEKLVVGNLMGEVPPELPGTPLQKHLEREQKRLRMGLHPDPRIYNFDLRNENDRARSHLLHRLEILDVKWGEKQEVTGKSGSFHEVWRLRWMPEFVLSLIEASVWGKTVEESATAIACDRSDKAADLATLTNLLDVVLLADLPQAVDHVIHRLETEAAVAVDIRQLMAALPALVQVARYGNVRKTDASLVRKILDGLISRICVGLPAACSSIDEAASEEIFDLLLKVHSAISLMQDRSHELDWQDALQKLSNGTNMSPLIAGRACRLLFDKKVFDSQEAARRFGLALSTAGDPSLAAAWADGFLSGSGIVLIHDNELFNVIDRWVQTLNEETFTQIVPLLRRTFSTYSAPERRQIGERVARSNPGGSSISSSTSGEFDLDAGRAALVLPIVAQILGLDKLKQTMDSKIRLNANE
jgi:hypothetical protein